MTPPATRTIPTRGGSVSLLSSGIIVMRGLGRVAHDFEVAAEGVRAIRELGGGAPRPALADIREIGALTREGRAKYSEHTTELLSAMAFLVGSSFSRVVGGLFVRLGRPEIPVRFFTSEAEALRWLSTLGAPASISLAPSSSRPPGAHG